MENEIKEKASPFLERLLSWYSELFLATPHQHQSHPLAELFSFFWSVNLGHNSAFF
jgi:hypothetical protein